MAEGPVERTMLYDFYGELLTPKQREYFDLHYNEDLSLAEIAENYGIGADVYVAELDSEDMKARDTARQVMEELRRLDD